MTSSSSTRSPIFVIGAGRSGTTMIRDALSSHPDVAAFEFEMNYLWRHGNENLRHDLLVPSEHLTADVSAHIRTAFVAEGEKQGRPVVLDKTVANVMRPAYLQAVFPGARILHVIRDGRAVTASACKRWAAPQPAGYFMSKLRTIPPASLPLVIGRYAARKLLSGIRRRNYRQSWGPRWPGIDEAVRDLPLCQVCAIQWRESVNAARSQVAELSPDTYMEIRYEDLVEEPGRRFEQIREFFGLEEDATFTRWVNSRIDSSRREKWREDLGVEQLRLVNEQIGNTLSQLDYR